MVPAVFVFLDFLPLTSNGKTDRNALPAPDHSRPEMEERFDALPTPIEEIIAVIWEDVLEIEHVGIDDNFFDLGGHSLLAVRMFSQIREGLGADLPLHVLFEAPTMGQFAARVEAYQEEKIHEGQKKGRVQLSYLRVQSGESQTPIFCFPIWAGLMASCLDLSGSLRSVGSEYSWAPGARHGWDIKAAQQRREDGCRLYPRNTDLLQSHGPYYLIGECLSGRVAYEAAQQLRARGEQVGLLAFLDYTAPRMSLAKHLQRSLFQQEGISTSQAIYAPFSASVEGPQDEQSAALPF